MSQSLVTECNQLSNCTEIAFTWKKVGELKLFFVSGGSDVVVAVAPREGGSEVRPGHGRGVIEVAVVEVELELGISGMLRKL